MSPKPLQGRKLSEIKLFKNSSYTARHIAAPIIAITMAGILFVYTRSSIYAAKTNAKRHREADGGQISWRNESSRRHGALEKPQEQATLKELLGRAEDNSNVFQGKATAVTPQEEIFEGAEGKAWRWCWMMDLGSLERFNLRDIQAYTWPINIGLETFGLSAAMKGGKWHIKSPSRQRSDQRADAVGGFLDGGLRRDYGSLPTALLGELS